jgi:hypothetical protein
VGTTAGIAVLRETDEELDDELDDEPVELVLTLPGR